MRRTVLTALAAAIMFSAGPSVHRAGARTAAAPAATAMMNSGFVREAAIVCGGNGCNPVHTKAEKKRKFQTLGHG